MVFLFIYLYVCHIVETGGDCKILHSIQRAGDPSRVIQIALHCICVIDGNIFVGLKDIFNFRDRELYCKDGSEFILANIGS